MKTVSNWDALRDYGIIALTGEACSLGYRILCDLTAQGRNIVQRCLSVTIQSENWNHGSDDDPHVASIMLTHDMLVPLGRAGRRTRVRPRNRLGRGWKTLPASR